MIVLNNNEQQIAEILIEAAIQKRTVTFTEIMQRVGISRKNLGKYLSNIGHKCIENNLPIITVLVVYKGNGKVGKGYTEFEPNFQNNPNLVKAEQKKVLDNKSWIELSENISEFDGVWVNDIAAEEGETVYVKRQTRIRDNRLRKKCLEQKGHVCAVCGFDGAKYYGKNFNEIIEVHHLNPVSAGKRKTTPDDLVPVCPNCHRALHSKQGKEPYTVQELKKIISTNKTKI